ncbi:hypothetical protein PC116_g23364 [Phytophthora cactorum]|nr:hypothetical protein PC116_g23364 [Phytophthora cactorum]
MLSEKGKIASITAEQKHSARLAAVCTIRADGLNLPLMFIVRGVPGGKIEENEIATCPKGHVYTVQKKAWMDARPGSLGGQQLGSRNLRWRKLFDCHVSNISRLWVSCACTCAHRAIKRRQAAILRHSRQRIRRQQW